MVHLGGELSVETVARDMNYCLTIPSIVAFKVIQNKVHQGSLQNVLWKDDVYGGKVSAEFVQYLMAISLHHDYS
jgi:hypothetical protein